MACEQETISTKAKLSKLHCPFTWEILNATIKHITYANSNFNRDEMDNVASCPLESLISHLFECYKAVLSTDEKAEAKIKNAEELLMQIQQEEGLHQTIRAIEHVFYATKCFFLYEADQMDQVEEILANIIDIDDFNQTEHGALLGCQSATWSCLNDFGVSKAIDTAKKAVRMDQDCALWHYILAKNLRRQRRSVDIRSEVSDVEEQHSQLAYALSKTNVFGVYMLQMRIEKFYKFSRDRDYITRKDINEREVLQIAKKIVASKPNNYKILLRLTLMFLRARNSDETLYAQRCLNEVRELAPGSSTYLHYTGMLYEQCGEFREALEYYKKAADSNNIIAEFAYVQYGWETGVVEPLPHLFRMLKKYNQTIEERLITILLAIATTYYLNRDIMNAAKYFLKALDTDPSSRKFKVFYKFLDFLAPNILIFLKRQFLPEAANYAVRHSTFEKTCERIKHLIILGEKDNMVDVTEEFQNISMNSENLHENSM